MPRSVAEKMGLRSGMRAYFAGAPDTARDAIELPALEVRETLRGRFDYIHLFVRSADEMTESFPRLKNHLDAAGMLWVSWPKGRRLESELTLPRVIEIGYAHGLVESKTLSVDSTWSAIKFTHPKPGKKYRNSYGALPDR